MGRIFKALAIGCLVITLLVCGGGFAAFRWVQQAYTTPRPPDPQIGRFVALRPLFRLKNGDSYSAGTAVAVRLQPGASPILLTAQHLFGPAGGLEAPVAPGDVDRHISSVLLVPFGGRAPVATARDSLRTTGAPLSEESNDVSGDVAAFKLAPGARVNALELAPANPGLGEWVWLVGDVFDHEPQTQRLFPGRAMLVSDGQALVKFEESFPLRAFSGAPLINAKKQVVGLLIGGTTGAAVVNPAGSIRKRLAESGVQ